MFYNCEMVIYVEYVILDNLIINTIIITLTLKLLKQKANKLNIALSALLGTGFSLLAPLLTFNSYILLPIKLVMGLSMVLVLKKYRNVKNIIITYLWFLTFTFGLGGMCFGILYMFNLNTSVNGIVINNFELPISVFILLLLFYIYILYKSLYIIKRKNMQHPYTFDVVKMNKNKNVNLEGFLDTCNHLYSNGQPVIIISKSLFLKLFKNAYSQNNNAKSILANPHYIEVTAVGKKNKMLVFNTDEVSIFTYKQIKTIKSATLGISQTNFNNEFDCLLHPDIII